MEIQRSRDRSNIYGEITASQAGTYIYQDIDTRHETDTVYTVSLRHANRGRPSDNNGHVNYRDDERHSLSLSGGESEASC